MENLHAFGKASSTTSSARRTSRSSLLLAVHDNHGNGQGSDLWLAQHSTGYFSEVSGWTYERLINSWLHPDLPLLPKRAFSLYRRNRPPVPRDARFP